MQKNQLTFSYLLTRISLGIILTAAIGATAAFAEGKNTEAKPASDGFENRCGWVDNPTPANWWLTDRDGEWVIGVPGG